MAFFGVTSEVIKSIEPIEGADRIQKATLEGLEFTFVVGKDLYKVGEQVLYFPIDSLIPIPLTEKLGVGGKLSGHGKNRVKTIRLKSVYSQGLVGKFSLLEPFLIAQYGEDWATKGLELKPEEITEWLGVTKYEPTEVIEKGANLKSLPGNLSVYDIEGTDRHNHIVEYMMDKLVRIDEKVEGQNVHFDYINGKFYVSQRRHTIEPIEGSEHTWWKYAKEENIETIIKTISSRYNSDIALYSEGCGSGIQGNYYNFSKHKCIFFDIKVGDRFLDSEESLAIFNEFNLPIAPIISLNTKLRDVLNGKTIVDIADGMSKLIDKNREGIVIRLMKEENIHRFGRSIIKKRGVIYLSKTDN